jgi:hypothetical protein
VGDQRLGIQFPRFNDLEVKRNMPGVLSVIEEHTPDPSQEGNYTLCQAEVKKLRQIPLGFL